MPVPSKMSDLFTLAASNSPAGSDLIGNTLDDYIRSHAAIIRSTNALASASVAAASTTDLSTSDGEQVSITGAATINSLGTLPSGIVRELSFTGICTLTNSTAMVLPFAANITTAAGDIYTFRSLGSGNWVMTSGNKASGFLPLTGGGLTGALTVTTAAPGGITINSSSTNNANIYLNNTSASGRNWAVGSSGSTGPGGAGYFAVYDNTSGQARMTIDPTGNVVFGPAVQATTFTVGADNILIYEASTGALGVRSGTSGGGYRFFSFDASGNFNTLSGGISSFTTLTANNSITFGTGNSTESDLFIQRSGQLKWYLSVNSSELFGLNRCNPATGAFAEQVLSFGQSGNLGFSRTCQAPDFVATSDERLKSSIKRLSRGLDALKQMPPREYVKDGEPQIGFIAQEAQHVIPEAVSEGRDGYLTMSYGQTVALVAGALLELVERLEDKGVL